MDDLGTIVIIRLHEIDGADADRNAYSLEGVEFLIDGGFVLKIANQGLNGGLCNNSIPVGCKSDLEHDTTRPLNMQWLAVNIAVTGELPSEKTEEDGLIDSVLPITVIFNIWTLLVKLLAPDQAANASLGAVLPCSAPSFGFSHLASCMAVFRPFLARLLVDLIGGRLALRPSLNPRPYDRLLRSGLIRGIITVAAGYRGDIA